MLDPGPPVADDPPEEHEHAAEREAAAVHERLEVRLRPRRQVVPAVLSVGLDLLSAILSFPPPIFFFEIFQFFSFFLFFLQKGANVSSRNVD